jgi:hypothetical protein
MAAPPPLLKTYNDAFALVAADPYQQNYGPLSHAFRSNNAPPDSNELYFRVASSDTTYPNAFLCVLRDDDGPTYCVIHAVCSYPGVLGQPSKWDELTFGFVGDVVAGSITSVEFPFEAFTIPDNYTNVPGSLERAREILDDNPENKMIGPFPDGDANIQQCMARPFFPLPPRYVNIFLGQRLPIREGFVKFSERLMETGDHLACPELSEWLLLSITQKTRDGANPPVLVGDFNVPLADAKLLTHRRQLLEKHLPGLVVPTAAETATELQEKMSNTLVRISEELVVSGERDERARQRSQAPKSVRKRFGSLYPLLLSLCGVDSEDELPPVWKKLAESGKQERQVLERELASLEQELGSPSRPLATPDLIMKIMSLMWGGRNYEDLTQGIHVFSIVVPEYNNANGDAAQDAQERSDAWDLVNDGGTTTLQDAEKVKKTKVVIPAGFVEGHAQLNSMGLLWVLLLGRTHPFVASYKRLMDLLNGRFSQFHVLFTNVDQARSATEPPSMLLFLRKVQILTTLYWQEAFSTGRLPYPEPEFVKPLRKLQQGDRGWFPLFPTKHYSRIKKPGKAITHGSEGGSVVSDLTGPTTSSGNTDPGGNKRTPLDKQTEQKNPQINSIFLPYLDKVNGEQVKTALARTGGGPQVTRNGRSINMCVSYHLKGKCWSGCQRKDDHGQHTPDEDNLLLNWCQAAYPADS